MNIREFHEKTLNIYSLHRAENPGFTFATRVRKSDSRLQNGYWFQGNDKYLFSSPYKAGDSNNKTKTIGFVLNFDEGEVTKQYIEVVFGDPRNRSMLDFYKSVLEICDMKFEENKYKYKKRLSGNWENNLKMFLAESVEKINKLIQEEELEDMFLISEKVFQKTCSNIENVKHLESLGISLADESNNKKSLEKPKEISVLSPQNIILYGPPGTGKTYNTKQRAVELVMETSLADSTREEVNELYDDFVKSGQIIFSTFHQSLSYEDFIEGIKPFMRKDSEDIGYRVEDGIFKKLSITARTNLENSRLDETEISEAAHFESLLSQFISHVEDKLVEGPYPLTESVNIIDVDDECFRYRGEAWERNKKGLRLKFDELKYIYHSGVETRQELRKLPDLSGMGVQHATYFYNTFAKLKEFEKQGFVSDVQTEKSNKEDLNQYVIVFDEINRGNVSSIFGELITLIETDKRIGQPEAIEVILPYSKKPFGVPPNLHIIGTMNTADRSVEALDTALRRRFTFEEMMPDPSLVKNNAYLMLAKLLLNFEDVDWKNNEFENAESELLKWLELKDHKSYHDNKNKVWDEFRANEDLMSYSDSQQYSKLVTEYFTSKGWLFNPIRLDYMLDTINKRLAYLLDRDHTIGHSFFMKVQSLSALRKIFSNQIIPQLKEYFYGDWNKIGMVLGEAFVIKAESDIVWPNGFKDSDDFNENINLSISSNWSADDFRSIYENAIKENSVGLDL